MTSKPFRKIPAVMCSQHPDNARKPYWHTKPYVATHHEIKEAHEMYFGLGAEEVMWDWEGKHVDQAVIEKMFSQYSASFSEKVLGKDIFLTFRVPNPRVEPGYRLGQAFLTILASRQIAVSLSLSDAPLFEVILPMTEQASEIVSLEDRYRLMAQLAAKSLELVDTDSWPPELEVIPLFESVSVILQAGDILREYLRLSKRRPQYLRPFLARSDPALNSGIVPTTLAIKWALSEFARLEEELGVALHPIIAPGSLPFRGGLQPKKVKQFLAEFAGVKTVVIQSAFRYDYPRAVVKKAIQEVIRLASDTAARRLTLKEKNEIERIIPWFEEPYRDAIALIAPVVGQISPQVPQRRERLQHIGLFGYSRQVGEVKLPRAIGFTASCYSLGVPPELIGTGRGLARAKAEGQLPMIEKLYPSLRASLKEAGGYLRPESLVEFGWAGIQEDVVRIEEYLGEKLQPTNYRQRLHQEVSGRIVEELRGGGEITALMEQAARLRNSVG